MGFINQNASPQYFSERHEWTKQMQILTFAFMEPSPNQITASHLQVTQSVLHGNNPIIFQLQPNLVINFSLENKKNEKILELLGFFFKESKGALYSCQVDTGMNVMLQRLSGAKNTTMHIYMAAGPLLTNHTPTIASIIFATKLMFIGKR